MKKKRKFWRASQRSLAEKGKPKEKKRKKEEKRENSVDSLAEKPSKESLAEKRKQKIKVD